MHVCQSQSTFNLSLFLIPSFKNPNILFGFGKSDRLNVYKCNPIFKKNLYHSIALIALAVIAFQAYVFISLRIFFGVFLSNQNFLPFRDWWHVARIGISDIPVIIAKRL